MLYRLALASAHRAVSRTQALIAAAGNPERFARAFDAAVEAVRTAEYAENLLARTEELWKQAHAITQHQTPSARGAWIASGEFQ